MLHQIIGLLKTYDNPRLWIKNVSWRFPSTVSEMDVVFVVGSPRSGTTLLQRILSVHSQLFSIQGETGLFSYQNIFDPKRKHFGLSDEQINKMFNDASDIVDFFSKGVSTLSSENNGKRFIEKTPQHILHLPFVLKYFPASHVIHIVRDGRDCYCSSKFHRSIPQNKSIRSFAKYWKKCVLAPTPYESYGKLFTVKYEQLVSAPQPYVQQIMNFIGLEVEEPQLDPKRFGADKRAQLNEFKKLSQSINRSSVGRWTSEMTEAEAQEFELIAGKELTHYGYSLTRQMHSDRGL